VALAVYSILSFHSTAKRGYLLLAGIQLALALGTKVTVASRISLSGGHRSPCDAAERHA
jgi:hypothetical protein